MEVSTADIVSVLIADTTWPSLRGAVLLLRAVAYWIGFDMKIHGYVVVLYLRSSNKTLVFRTETARCFVSLKISLRHSRSVKVI